MEMVRADARRVSRTPNATMTTLASPTQGGSAGSVWWVDMAPGAAGPEHAFGAEVVWSFTAGAATVYADGSEVDCLAGDTVVLPGGLMRRFVAGPEGFTAVVSSPFPSSVTRGDGQGAGVPAWVT